MKRDSIIRYEMMCLLTTIKEKITAVDEISQAAAQDRLNQLIKPPGSLGKLEDICIKLAGIYGQKYFTTDKKVILAFAADHGVYEEGVTIDQQQLTKMQTLNFARGINGVGTLAKFAKSALTVVDVGICCDEPLPGVLNRKIRQGTWNMAKGAAMTRAEAIQSLAVGIETARQAVQDGHRVIGIGEMGIANTTASSAIVAVFSGCDPLTVTGKGAGLPTQQILHKAEVIRRAIALNQPNSSDSLDVLMKIGGFEIGAMAGAILGASEQKVPVVLDGFISYAAALIACGLAPLSRQYMIASHYSAESGTQKALSLLELEPALHMDMWLGEGSGAALAFDLIEAANFTYQNMATLAECHLSR